MRTCSISFTSTAPRSPSGDQPYNIQLVGLTPEDQAAYRRDRERVENGGKAIELDAAAYYAFFWLEMIVVSMRSSGLQCEAKERQ